MTDPNRFTERYTRILLPNSETLRNSVKSKPCDWSSVVHWKYWGGHGIGHYPTLYSFNRNP